MSIVAPIGAACYGSGQDPRGAENATHRADGAEGRGSSTRLFHLASPNLASWILMESIRLLTANWFSMLFL
jgi:hypothetical protein